MAISDNNTTGRFTKQSYALDEIALTEGGPPRSTRPRRWLGKGIRFLVLALPADEVLAVSEAAKADAGGGGASTPPPPTTACAAPIAARNVFHVSRAGRCRPTRWRSTSPLMRWRKMFLIVGPTGRGQALRRRVRDSAKKFALKVTAEKPWTFGPLAKARGDTPTRAEAMVFTRGLDYDMAIVADEAGDWGDYVPYRTVDPRPVGGTQGLIATTWQPTLETWGAAQAQNRFRRLAGRLMRPLDYQVWAAVRSVGEAATQKKTADPAVLAAYLADPAFGLPAYKGVSLSYRPWDHQLRQPMIVVQPKALVSVAPEQGFPHQRTPLDTLGTDLPQTTCKFPD